MSATTSATLTATVTSTSASISASATSCTPDWTIPTTDAACGIQVSGNGSDVMKQCCGVASVVSYNNGCTEYCLAQDQDIGDLTNCISSNGVAGNSVFCNNGTNVTATAAVSSTASSTGTASSTSTKSSASSTSTTGAAAPGAKVSAGGVGVLALLFCSALLGGLA